MVISIRVDDEIKEQVDELFEDLGMNISVAVNVFFRACLRKQGIPFEIVMDEDRNKKEDNGVLEYFSKEDLEKILEQIEAAEEEQ